MNSMSAWCGMQMSLSAALRRKSDRAAPRFLASRKSKQ
jgi:hypothetical protein